MTQHLPAIYYLDLPYIQSVQNFQHMIKMSELRRSVKTGVHAPSSAYDLHGLSYTLLNDKLTNTTVLTMTV